MLLGRSSTKSVTSVRSSLRRWLKDSAHPWNSNRRVYSSLVQCSPRHDRPRCLGHTRSTKRYFNLTHLTHLPHLSSQVIKQTTPHSYPIYQILGSSSTYSVFSSLSPCSPLSFYCSCPAFAFLVLNSSSETMVSILYLSNIHKEN